MECLLSLYKIFCCIKDPIFPVPYNFQFGQPHHIEHNKTIFQSNFIRTSKYHWYDFIPKSLLLQFKRLANVYFLIIGILQSIPIISPLGPLTAWAPLCVVLAISMLRQGYQDYQRYKSDQQLNFQSKTQVYRNGDFVTVQWSQVVVGQIVRVQSQQLFPVDLILLSSSIQGGIAFIETASLDGQKNLKPRSSFPQTQKYQTVQSLKKFNGRWQGIVPDKQLHKFSSNLILGTGQIVNYNGDKQLLYRGARLKNTKFIYGMSIYTGCNSKIMMNSDSASQKMSQIQVKVNYILVMILVIQAILCLIVAIINGIFLKNNKQKMDYIIASPFSSVVDSILIFCSYFVLINTMIPISLIVSMQIVKVSQSYFIDKDRLMYSQFRKKNCNVKSSSLNQQLGQIQYIFTDKTGTLTMNLMEFKIAVIGRKMYGDLGLIINDPKRPPQNNKGFRDQQLKQLIYKGQNNMNVNDIFVKNRQGNSSINFKNMKQLAQEYLTALSIAHQVVAQHSAKKGKFYQGPSPDQITLVDAARDMGYQFQRANQTQTQISVKGQKKKFQLLQTFPFTSDRKRMSVIVRSNGMIKLYMKGADSIVKSRLAKDQRLNLDQQLNSFSRIGLRTLLIGMRIISNDQYNTFKRNVQGLPAVNKQQALDKLISDIQQNIYLIGATAVLDRLQDQVPQTIRDLIRANIKIWMLTGDKMQTAQNIAKSCNLIQKDFKILRYECKDPNLILHHLRDLNRLAQEMKYRKQPKGFLIQGQDLVPIIGNQERQIQLANLAKYCQAVVCCRLFPIQKAEVVRIVRTRLNKITLSIGDGNNDIPMIRTAHLGVGLFGQEGMGAVQSSDYALPQFRMLWRLILVHGRWNYMRISQMILYFFYKNMLFTLPQFIFAFYCGYSGQTIFDDVYISLYNLFFTSLPLVVRAILQQDVYYVQPSHKQQTNAVQDSQDHLQIKKKHTVLNQSQKYVPQKFQMNKYLYRLFPKIYFIGQQNCIFNYRNFFLWVLQGAIQAVLITMFSLYILGTSSLNQQGHSTDMWIVSLTIFTSVVFQVTFKLSTHTKFWSVFLFISIIFFSLALYIGYMWISNYYFSDYLLGTITVYFKTPQTYFVVLFCICFVLFVDGFVLNIDFQRGGYASRMRKLIADQKQANLRQYNQYSIRSSQVNTIRPRTAARNTNQ